MNNAYRVFCTITKEVITISAKSMEDASLYYMAWMTKHFPPNRIILDPIEEVDPEHLGLEPQLQKVVYCGLSGIARWLGHKKGWTIIDPDGDLIGKAAPPKPKAQCYRFYACEGLGDVYIVAKDMDEAQDIFGDYVFDELGHGVKYEDFDEVSPWLFSDEMLRLRKDIFKGKCGVGLPKKNGTWKVFKVD